MKINLKKIGCTAIGSGLFLGGVHIGTKLTKENITRGIEKVLYGDEINTPRRMTYSNYYAKKEKNNEK